MKKKILVIAAIVICVSMAAYGTLAFFTYEETATNVITVGNIKIALEYLTDNGDSLVPCENEIDTVLPATDVSRVVQVKNVGGHDAWIRLSVDKAFTLAEGVEGNVDLSLISFNLNTAFWEERDGYYYYLSALKPGETTEPLFTTVTFSPQMDNMYMNSKAIININAQATQVANNGSTVFEAAGWPASE